MTPADLPELPPEKGTWDEKEISRRGLLEGAVGVLATVGVLHIAIPGGIFLVGKSLEPAKTQWVQIGEVASISADQVTRINYTMTAPDAWRNVTKSGTVYVYSEDGGTTFVAMDGTCTHLGCMVQWKSDENVFGCPCHLAVFSRQGNVLSGPPPKPLRQLAVKIENGVLFAEI